MKIFKNQKIRVKPGPMHPLPPPPTDSNLDLFVILFYLQSSYLYPEIRSPDAARTQSQLNKHRSAKSHGMSVSLQKSRLISMQVSRKCEKISRNLGNLSDVFSARNPYFSSTSNKNVCLYPLNRVGFWRSRKTSPTTPPPL